MATDVRSFTQAFRAAQARRAALVAALVSIYLRRKVAIEDPAAVERFLDLMVPKILEEHEGSAVAGAKFANDLRRLEVPGTEVPFRYEPVVSLNTDQIRSSIQAVGVNAYLKKVRTIRELDEKQFARSDKAAMIREADQVASERVARAVERHVQNGHRRTIEEGAKQDPLTIGYVRVTKPDPCFFCAMLASRGLEGGLYVRDSFDMSDPRFVGDGTAKVHDGCGCGLKPVYTRADPILGDNQKFTDAWYEFSGDGDADALTNFRRHWEGRPAYLKSA